MGERRTATKCEIGPVVRGTGRTREMDAIPREPLALADFDVNDPDREVELGFSREQAAVEAVRCYQCQYLFEIDNQRCIYCDMCVLVCPVPNASSRSRRWIATARAAGGGSSGRRARRTTTCCASIRSCASAATCA
jgi:ferredoxin